jgi:general secretion pathway protein C
MSAFLKVSPWYGGPANLAAIAACAGILGHTAASSFDRAAPVFVPVTRPRARPAAAPTEVAPIVARNIFCSTCNERAEPAVVRPAPTTLPLALVAVLYAPPPFDVRSSLAVVRDTEDRRLSIVGIGDDVHGATVVDIDETRIHLRHQGRRELLHLLEPTDRAPSPVPAGGGLAATGISRVGERAFEIERATLDVLLADTTGLMKAARIVPEVRDGRATGFRLHAVRPDGVFARIGLRSGDVVVGINGLPLTSPESGLEAFVKLRSASHVSLELEREGRRVSFDYRIR